MLCLHFSTSINRNKMLRFFNRPIFTFATFIFLLIRLYLTVIDIIEFSHFPIVTERNSMSQLENIPKVSGFSETEREPESSHIPTNLIVNTKITLGTFEALNGIYFVEQGQEDPSLFTKPDAFSDLQRALENIKQDQTESDAEKTETLGETLNLSSEISGENSMTRFHSDISRYRMYPENSKAVEDLLYDMTTQPICRIRDKTGGTQFKLTIGFNNHVLALFKPKRVSREQQKEGDFPEYERHTSEIAAFHLDRVLGFRRALPVVGRKINLIVDMLRLASPDLKHTFFISPKPDENVCFIGTACTQFCDKEHPICGNGTIIEGSFMAYFPVRNGTERIDKLHPWARSTNEWQAPWETNPNYCNSVKTWPGFSQGRLLLELVDLSIFDFIIANEDRHRYQTFKAFYNDTFALRYDNGRAFGHAYHDELKILAPLMQCCVLRSSTLTNLLNIHNSDKPLSLRMEESMSNDPIAPVLWRPHLNALDRRLMIVLHAIRDCVDKKAAENVILPTESADFREPSSD